MFFSAKFRIFNCVIIFPDTVSLSSAPASITTGLPSMYKFGDIRVNSLYRSVIIIPQNMHNAGNSTRIIFHIFDIIDLEVHPNPSVPAQAQIEPIS